MSSLGSGVMRLRCAVLLGAAMLGACTAPKPTPGAPMGVWTAAPSMLSNRAAHAVVTDGGQIYALAGTGAGGAPVLAVERFDGETWREVAMLPGAGLNAPAAALLDGRIYLAGGFRTDTNIPTDQVLVYDIERGTWSEAAPLPEPRGGHAAVVLNGRIHVFGGGNAETTLAAHSAYDPATNAWVELRPLSRPKGSPAAVVRADRIWVIGGRSGFSDFGDVEIYDPQTDRWTRGPAIPPRGTHGAVVYHDAILVIGGESQAERRSLAGVLQLDPQSDVWRNAPPLPTARSFARSVVAGGAVYVVGGSLDAGPSHAAAGSRVVERFAAPGPGS